MLFWRDGQFNEMPLSSFGVLFGCGLGGLLIYIELAVLKMEFESDAALYLAILTPMVISFLLGFLLSKCIEKIVFRIVTKVEARSIRPEIGAVGFSRFMATLFDAVFFIIFSIILGIIMSH